MYVLFLCTLVAGQMLLHRRTDVQLTVAQTVTVCAYCVINSDSGRVIYHRIDNNDHMLALGCSNSQDCCSR